MNVLEVDVLIIGAGVVGAAIARELARYQLDVAVLEKEVDVAFGASKANSGIVHSGIHEHPGTLNGRLCLRGNRLFPQLATELNFLYKNNGSIIVAADESEKRSLTELNQNAKTFGMDCSPLSTEELLKLEPNLHTSLVGGLLVPSGGIVVSFDLVFALMENAIMNGVKLYLETKALQISPQSDVIRVQTNRGDFSARFVINAAGLYSAEVAKMAGDESFTILPRKGEEYLMDRKLEGLMHRTIFPLPSPISKGILIIPTVDGNIMIGPTAKQVESLTDTTTSTDGWQDIFTATRRLLPSLSASDLITSFAGVRATSDREEFIIQPSTISPRLIHTAGIKSPGLTASPAIAEYVVEILQEQGLKIKPQKGFNPHRPIIRLRDLSPARQAALMRTDPAYARIVCRCETVSEGEIRDAIKRGATTMDGVKLRTRAGMGRCQGGFCLPKILQILSKERTIPPENITKNGPGSEYLFGRLRPGKEEDHARTGD